MVLSQERSITHAFVLSGDEDLREGVAYAQDRGVFVGLLGIRGAGGTSQSRELTRESDVAIDVEATEAAKVSLARTSGATVTGPVPPPGVASASFDCVSVVKEFVDAWRAGTSAPEITDLLAARPVIPQHLDGHLLTSVSQKVLGGGRLDENQKRTARREFWDLVCADTIT